MIQGKAWFTQYSKFKEDKNLVKFITKTIKAVLNTRMGVIERQNQEHIRRLHIANK